MELEWRVPGLERRAQPRNEPGLRRRVELHGVKGSVLRKGKVLTGGGLAVATGAPNLTSDVYTNQKWTLHFVVYNIE